MTSSFVGLTLCLAACGTTNVPVVEPNIVPAGWVAVLGDEPETFTDLIDPSRDAWAALHRHDYMSAIDGFSPDSIPLARAQLAMVTLHTDLARVVAVGSAARGKAWKARKGSLPADAQVATEWAAHCETTPNEPSLQARRALHDAAVKGPTGALVSAALQPAIGNHFDPCVNDVLAQHWAHAMNPEGDWSASMGSWSHGGLESSLFAPWLTAVELGAHRTPSTTPGTEMALARGLPALNAMSDDPEAARRWVRDLDAVLDSWALALRSDATHDALDLLDGLEPVARYRQEILIVSARQALLDDHPRQAMALLQRARDASSREVGPTNAPSLFALTAEAQVRLGHAREALDALHPLAARFPTVVIAQEIIGDLAVLQGMDRRGDSKENP